MRVGAALDMLENGIDLVPIMHAGGWKSPGMVLRYTQQIDLAKSGARTRCNLQDEGRRLDRSPDTAEDPLPGGLRIVGSYVRSNRTLSDPGFEFESVLEMLERCVHPWLPAGPP